MEVKNRVKELIEIFETSGLSEMEFDADGLKLKLKKANANPSFGKMRMTRSISKAHLSELFTLQQTQKASRSLRWVARSKLESLCA